VGCREKGAENRLQSNTKPRSTRHQTLSPTPIPEASTRGVCKCCAIMEEERGGGTVRHPPLGGFAGFVRTHPCFPTRPCKQPPPQVGHRCTAPRRWDCGAQGAPQGGGHSNMHATLAWCRLGACLGLNPHHDGGVARMLQVAMWGNPTRRTSDPTPTSGSGCSGDHHNKKPTGLTARHSMQDTSKGGPQLAARAPLEACGDHPGGNPHMPPTISGFLKVQR
jgi:hypothetical protein